MRARLVPVALVVLLLVPASASSTASDPELPDKADAAFVDLKTQALYEREPSADPVDRIREALSGPSQASLANVTDAWRTAQNASGPPAREAILEAEGRLLEHARDEAHHALAEGDATAARAWLGIPLERVDWQARSIPARGLLDGDGLDEENLTEVLDAALAVRAREAVMEALLLDRTGAREDARATANGAQALLATLIPEASRRLPDALRTPLEENATGIAADVLAVPNGTSDHFLTGLLAPLTALEYNHRIEVLEEFGARNIDPAFVVARTVQEDPGRADDLAEAAFHRYATDRSRLFLMGEGTAGDRDLIQDADDAYRELRRAARNLSQERAEEAAADVAQTVGRATLLDPGFTLKVETGGVQPNRTHDYDVVFLRPTLEGVSSYRLRLSYDPSIVEIVDVEPRQGAQQTLRVEHGAGTVTVDASFDRPLVENTRLVNLRIEARGEPLAETNVTIEEALFRDADGDSLEPFRLRDGHATVAKIDTGTDESPEPAQNGSQARPTPGPTALLAALSTGAAALGRARRRL